MHNMAIYPQFLPAPQSPHLLLCLSTTKSLICVNYTVHQKKKIKIGAASVKSTSHKRIYNNKIGEVSQPCSLDFGALHDHATTAAAVASKGEEEERVLPPLKEINIEDAHIPFKCQTSDITSVLTPKQNNTSFFPNNNDDDDDEDDESMINDNDDDDDDDTDHEALGVQTKRCLRAP
eukprot:13637577-Ditylum_brightwellii.AAC.1